MPNTLAHIGVQGLLHRTWCSRLDLRWSLVLDLTSGLGLAAVLLRLVGAGRDGSTGGRL